MIRHILKKQNPLISKIYPAFLATFSGLVSFQVSFYHRYLYTYFCIQKTNSTLQTGMLFPSPAYAASPWFFLPQTDPTPFALPQKPHSTSVPRWSKSWPLELHRHHGHRWMDCLRKCYPPNQNPPEKQGIPLPETNSKSP